MGPRPTAKGPPFGAEDPSVQNAMDGLSAERPMGSNTDTVSNEGSFSTEHTLICRNHRISLHRIQSKTHDTGTVLQGMHYCAGYRGPTAPPTAHMPTHSWPAQGTTALHKALTYST